MRKRPWRTLRRKPGGSCGDCGGDRSPCSAERRQAVVEYGLQFVGNRYVYGGTNPNKGADCSGFTSYVLRHSAGVELPTPPDPRLSRAVRSAQQRSVRAIWYSMPAESASTMWPCISATARCASQREDRHLRFRMDLPESGEDRQRPR